jgi:FkbM family methyltransferase
MTLRRLFKYLLFRDTTMQGEFSLMENLRGADCPRIIIDVGANDGFYGSNSFPYIVRGWRALLIEPHPVAFGALRARHAGRKNVTCLNLACGAAEGTLPLWTRGDDTSLSTLDPVSHPHFTKPGSAPASNTVEVRRLDSILSDHEFPKELGILSIDTEGWDYEVILGLDLKQWRPRLIVTEDTRRPDEAKKIALLNQHGYVCQQKIARDSFWVRS